MNNLLIAVLQCGTLTIVPIVTFGIGLWLVNRFVGFQSRISLTLVAFVIGTTIFVGAFLGMSIDPRASLFGTIRIIKTSGMIGLGAVIFVHIIVPIYLGLVRILK
jgi:ABC-type spermidine/putrescine transport system permease subunit II